MATHDSVIQQGRFTSDGTKQTLSIRSGVDFIETFNLTRFGAQAGGQVEGIRFYWQRGMGDDFALFDRKQANSNLTESVSTNIAGGGFTFINTAEDVLGPIRQGAIQNIDGNLGVSQTPRVTVNNLQDLENGDIVRILDVQGGQQLGGLDFTITNVGANNNPVFDLIYGPRNIPDTQGGDYRLVRFNPIYYPRNRTVTNITQAQQAVVRLSVDHNYTVGQTVRFVVPPEFGMTEMDGLQGTITAVNTTGNNNTITVDIDSTNFTPFVFPNTNAVPFTPAQIVPVGADGGNTGDDQHVLDGATINEALIGVQLSAGYQGPAGRNGDVIYWRAGTSYSVDN